MNYQLFIKLIIFADMVYIDLHIQILIHYPILNQENQENIFLH
jgi:hypothetical protein